MSGTPLARRGSLLLAAGIAALWLPAAAQAATDHVTRSGDSGKTGQLRYVIAHAASGDAVVIDSGVDPSLTKGEIRIAKNLRIKGQGARATTINANGDSRIFVLGSSSGPGHDVSIAHLTLTGGKTTGLVADSGTDGGALITWKGKLSLTDVTLTGNEAFANSEFNGSQGGAIANEGAHLFLNRVTMTGNAAVNAASGGGTQGGAVAAFGPTTITNSTIAGNTAQDTGSGGSVAEGGGLQGGYSLKLISSTVADNSATDADVAMSFSEGGNIYTQLGTTTLMNTIVAGGNARTGSNCQGSFTDDGHNLESTTPSQCGLSASAPNYDQIGSDPQLATSSPADNGGETDTLALKSTSPAIDYVPAADCTTAAGTALTVDQREKVRPDAGEQFCDIGAFEHHDPSHAP